MRSISKSFSLTITLVLLCISLNAQTKTLNLESFEGLSVAGNIDLILIPDSENYAEIEVKNIDIDRLETRKKGSTLKFNLKNRGILNLFRRNGKAFIKLHYTEELINISSSASAYITSNNIIKADDLRISSSSGATIELEIECNVLDASVSSGADVLLEGKINTQEISASSGGAYKATRLSSEKTVAKASSGASIKIWVTNKIKARASSGGSINYNGNPSHTDTSSSSGGSIRSLRSKA